MRILSPSALAALDAGRFAVRSLIVVDMPTELVGFWDDCYDATIEGQLYLATNGGFSVSGISSGADLAARNVDITISGLDSNAATRIEAAGWHQRPITLSLALMAIDTPQTLYVNQWFAGFLDQLIRRERAGDKSTLVFRCESLSRELGRKGTRRRSDADQRQLGGADDGFFKHTVAASTLPVEWGRRQTQPQKKPKFLGIF